VTWSITTVQLPQTSNGEASSVNSGNEGPPPSRSSSVVIPENEDEANDEEVEADAALDTDRDEDEEGFTDESRSDVSSDEERVDTPDQSDVE
jgi:hypothetical protein